MKQTPLKRKTPMSRGTSTLKRSSFQPKKREEHKEGLKQGTKRLRSRKSSQKSTPIRQSAKDENCTLRFPGICRNRTDTTVWCHSNSLVDGKGMGLKAPDEEGCYGCYECHCYLDGGWVQEMWRGVTRDLVDEVFSNARKESRQILRNKGLICDL
ncbi:nuclease domain-containing protein [Herbaspirillum sp. GCM10030257]|uniref:nuclease domain-containing protein n=1 Tax=Herbaspirillum sp. GCM10030257 TaxID=3273393 RepID=UPI003606BD3D